MTKVVERFHLKKDTVLEVHKDAYVCLRRGDYNVPINNEYLATEVIRDAFAGEKIKERIPFHEAYSDMCTDLEARYVDNQGWVHWCDEEGRMFRDPPQYCKSPNESCRTPGVFNIVVTTWLYKL